MALTGDIVAGSHAGPIALGATKDACTALLGEADQRQSYDSDVYFLAWAALGLQISFKQRDDKANRIACFFTDAGLRATLTVGDSRLPDAPLGVVTLATDLGVGPRSAEDDVTKRYGKPTKAYRGDDEGGWCRLEYPGIDFRFTGGALESISLRPGKKPKKK